jgi:hypothetical protein
MLESKVKKVKTELKRMKDAIEEMEKKAVISHGSFWGPKETGAVRRASMDLTRSLADLRKSKYIRD